MATIITRDGAAKAFLGDCLDFHVKIGDFVLLARRILRSGRRSATGCMSGCEPRSVSRFGSARRTRRNLIRSVVAGERLVTGTWHGQERRRLRGTGAQFATEKDSPYLRWVRNGSLDVIGAHYVANLRTGRLKPGRDAAAAASSSTHEASRTSNDCYVCEIPRAGKLEPQRQLYEEMILALDGRGSTTVGRRRDRISFEWKAGACSPSRSTPGTAFQRPLGNRTRPVRRG